jgi:penicillin V acylase-like amidase (Ntn superfamily)/uncharacterized protein (DUF2141 family)
MPAMKKLLFTLLTLTLIIKTVYPCSAIVLKNDNQILLAKNFDWTYGDGIIMKNLRGIKKTAYFTQTGEQAQWTSKYGSVTFNQNGREMPYGGMNEKGLAIEMLWLEVTQYNINEKKAYVNELEWIQYQLDNFESVKQVIDHLSDLSIYPIKGKIHYILSDIFGKSVIIEYLNGKPTAYEKDANVCQTITNNSVIYSESFKNQVKGIKKRNTSTTFRYYKLEQEILTVTNQSKLNEAYAFEVLKKVNIPKGSFRTLWSIVYNISQKSISFHTDTHKEIKTIQFSALDFTYDISYFPLNQNEVKNLSFSLIGLTESDNLVYLAPSLMHLGFDEAVTRDINKHHFMPMEQKTSIYSTNYFHFEISAPMNEEMQTGFLAVIDSEESFKNKQAVTGGYLYGNIGKGMLVVHIYGLKNGTYSMLSFIDTITNRRLDFDESGKPLEKYASFNDFQFSDQRDISFSNTSAEFNQSNAKVMIKWK